MGTVTTTYWKCDRCGAEEKVRPRRPYDGGDVSLIYEVHSGIACHEKAIWKELCHTCSSVVEGAMHDLIHKTK